MDRAERIRIARELSDGFVGRFAEKIVATGIRGSVAREEDNEHSDVDMVIVTREPDLVGSQSLLLGPIAVEVKAIDVTGYFREAKVIGPWWPLLADQYIHATPLHDPSDFYKDLRRVYDEAMTAATDDQFIRAEAQDIVQAVTWAYKARATAGNAESLARMAISESALRAVLSLGLRARFIFKNIAHAFKIFGQLPGVPSRFPAGIEKALSSKVDAPEAVAALEESIEALLEAAIERGVPITAEGAEDFL